jgi:tetratricopeptide (TPR) repeat protein
LALSPHEEEIVIGARRYRALIDDGPGRVVERGPEGEATYPMVHVLGGKNVYYFLTPLDRGRLQTLPIAYDVREKAWFDTAASGMRHVTDEAVDWRDPVYTFNTACYRCHVSQLSLNYDLESDTYNTRWVEPGINCETCHGSGEEHVRLCTTLPEGKVLDDWKIKRGGSSFSVDQNNDTCAPCHAKMSPLTSSFEPGDRFFDHYDLTTLEDPDFHPDGRDLGENYTHTAWLMNPCVKSGQLSCLHCHTSSGRFKHADDPNAACLPCHRSRVKNAASHTHHPEESAGSLCISCHMPMTEFARMRRSDHSMLPPTPAATIAFDSPNACNLCHADQTPEWADQLVREWHGKDCQEPVLRRAGLIADARKRNWERLSEMIRYIESEGRDAVFTASLIRLLRACSDPELEPVLLRALKDGSPLVRSAAAESLRATLSEKTIEALIEASGDEFRLVRVRAAASLAGAHRSLARTGLSPNRIETIRKATMEFLESLLSRPDHWSSHYNLGNFFIDNGDARSALASYETALRLEPRAILVLVNASMAYAGTGDVEKAEEYLRRALEIEPESAVAHFNMGLLKAERSDNAAAEKHLRAALAADPKMAGAAFNLGVLLAEESTEEAIDLLARAFETQPTPRYGYTLAFFLRQDGQLNRAVDLLNRIIEEWPLTTDAILLLGDIYRQQGKKQTAEDLYRNALKAEGISDEDRTRLEMQILELRRTKD